MKPGQNINDIEQIYNYYYYYCCYTNKFELSNKWKWIAFALDSPPFNTPKVILSLAYYIPGLEHQTKFLKWKKVLSPTKGRKNFIEKQVREERVVSCVNARRDSLVMGKLKALFNFIF